MTHFVQTEVKHNPANMKSVSEMVSELWLEVKTNVTAEIVYFLFQPVTAQESHRIQLGTKSEGYLKTVS